MTPASVPSNCSVDDSRLTAIDRAAMTYVTLPAFPFLLGWFVFPLNVIAAGSYGWALWRMVGHGRGSAQIDRRQIVAVAVCAALWVALSGIGHLVYANAFDWLPRFALARDLVALPWPVTYEDGEVLRLLRAPLGYFLIPALVGKVVGLRWLDTLLYLWTAIGVALLLQILVRGKSCAWALIAIAIFAFASGLDVIGFLVREGTLPAFGEHIEWWASSYQYSSNTTLLFWVPNHALAAWIATGLLVRHLNSSAFLYGAIFVLFPALALWQPLSAAGILPLWLAAVLQQRQHGVKLWESLDIRTLLLVALPLICVAQYLALDVLTVPRGLPGTDSGFLERVKGLPLFYVLEVMLPGGALLLFRRRPLDLAALLFLAVLPLFSFGAGNDLVMRASIPALATMWIGLADELSRPRWNMREQRFRITLAAAFLLIGSVTPVQEIARGLMRPRWAPDLQLSLPSAFTGGTDRTPRYPPHYFVTVRHRDDRNAGALLWQPIGR